jgi:uncharacterized membrane protein YsdA (DUF1294 family)
MIDFIKAAILLIAYFVGGPMLGAAIAGKRHLERAIFCLMVFMTAWVPSKFTLMVDSIDRYRGHTKGFEGSLIEVLAIALIVAAHRTRKPGFRLLPPGTWIYLGWCALMMISIFHAYSAVHAWMAFVKFTMAVLLYIAGSHFLRDERDLTWLARTMAGMVILMCLVCLKMRLIEGRFRTVGWFEHQNPMAMWSYFCAMPVLALGLRAQTPKNDALLYFAAVGAAGINVILSVSRGALGAFGIGCMIVMFLAYLRGPSKRLVTMTVLGGFAGALVAATALHSVFARMKVEKERGAEEDLRLVMIAQARAMLHDSPIGIGWNNYGIADSRPIERYSIIMEEWDASRGFRIYEENYGANPLTESYYWLMLGENGYPGITGCALFFAWTLWMSVRCLSRFWKTSAGWFTGGVFVAIALHYVHSQIERVLTQTKNLSLWLLIVGVVAGLENRRRAGKTQPLALADSPRKGE